MVFQAVLAEPLPALAPDDLSSSQSPGAGSPGRIVPYPAPTGRAAAMVCQHGCNHLTHCDQTQLENIPIYGRGSGERGSKMRRKGTETSSRHLFAIPVIHFFAIFGHVRLRETTKIDFVFGEIGSTSSCSWRFSLVLPLSARPRADQVRPSTRADRSCRLSKGAVDWRLPPLAF